MKTKIIGNTYLRDIEKYELKMFFDDDYYIICVKKLVQCREKYIIKNKTNKCMNIDYMKYLTNF